MGGYLRHESNWVSQWIVDGKLFHPVHRSSVAPHAGCAYHQERMINVAAWFHLVLLVLLFSLILVQLLILFIPFILFRSMLPPPPPSPPSAFFWLHSDDIGAPIFIIFIHPILKASGEVGTGGIVDLSQSIIYYARWPKKPQFLDTPEAKICRGRHPIMILCYILVIRKSPMPW